MLFTSKRDLLLYAEVNYFKTLVASISIKIYLDTSVFFNFWNLIIPQKLMTQCFAYKNSQCFAYLENISLRGFKL
jgi:hypothetical protein